MDHESRQDASDDHRWRRVRAAFFRAPKPPTSFETEAFVRRVMARVEQPPATVFPWGALFGARWLVPALSLGLGMLLVSILRPGLENADPLDTLLLIDGSGSGVAELVLPAQAAREPFLPAADAR